MSLDTTVQSSVDDNLRRARRLGLRIALSGTGKTQRPEDPATIGSGRESAHPRLEHGRTRDKVQWHRMSAQTTPHRGDYGRGYGMHLD
ncbi:hypothetical protein VTO42DRAFT_873 [Malbranchea cinnamomea]